MKYDRRKIAKKLIKVLKEKYGKSIERHHFSSNSFKLLIATILSQRTRDENTERAATSLFSVADTPEKILNLSNEKLERLIKSSGMYRQKAKKIKETCRVLIERYNGVVPDTREELLKLPGVGQKTSNVVLSYGYGKPVIAVDVHVEVTSKRLGLVPQNASVREVEDALEKLIPKKDKRIINLGLVRFGREICTTRNPKCYLCPLSKACLYNRNRMGE